MADKVLMKGNEAIAEAAILAGCKHYFGYPITPQTEIAAYMAKKMPKIGSIVITEEGKGTVISNNMLKYLVKVKIEKGDGSLVYKEFPLDSIKITKANREEDIEKMSKEEAKNLKDIEDDN